MNKESFVKQLAEKLKLKKVAAEMIFDDVIEILTNAIAKEKSVKLMNLGVFQVRRRAEKYCINPKTRERILVPAKQYVQFTASKKLVGKIKKEGSKQ